MLNNKCKVELKIEFVDKDVLWRLTERDLYKIKESLSLGDADYLGNIFDIMINVKKQNAYIFSVEGPIGFKQDEDDDIAIEAEFEIDWSLIVGILNNKMHLRLLSNEDIKKLYRQPIMDQIVNPLFKRLNKIFKYNGLFRPINIPLYKKEIDIRPNNVDFSVYQYLGEIGFLFNICISAVAHSSGDKHV